MGELYTLWYTHGRVIHPMVHPGYGRVSLYTLGMVGYPLCTRVWEVYLVYMHPGYGGWCTLLVYTLLYTPGYTPSSRTLPVCTPLPSGPSSAGRGGPGLKLEIN